MTGRADAHDRTTCRALSLDGREVACCGEKPVGVAGQPLVNSCQLCPKSPTYWRTGRTGTASPSIGGDQ